MSSKKTVDLFGEKCLPVGCKVNGGLTPALAPVKCKSNIPAGTIFIGYAEGAGRYFACTKTAAYVSVNGSYFVELEPLAGSSPFMVEDVYGGKPRGLLVNGNGVIWHDGGAYSYTLLKNGLACGAMHCGRLFGADGSQRNMLRWSAEGVDDRSTGLNGSGSIVLDPERGDILDLTVFGGKLTAVRKFGLTVLNMFGSPENFSVAITDTDTEEIAGGTARSVGGGLYFYTASGLCRFDGSGICRVAHRFTDDISAPVCSAALGGKYFLSCTSRSAGRVIFCYDTEDGESWLAAVPADLLWVAGGRLYAYNSDGIFALGEGEYSLTVNSDFGTDGRKTVTKICVGGSCDLQISNGSVTRTFKNAHGKLRPHMRGESFTVKLSGSGSVNYLTATAEVMNGI